MHSSRGLFFAFLLVQLLWNKVAANRVLSSLPKNAMIRPIACDACIGPKPFCKYLDFMPCKAVKTSWSFQVALGTERKHNRINIVNNKNGYCITAESLHGKVTERLALSEGLCEDQYGFDMMRQQFKITFVKGEGWHIQHYDSKLYLRRAQERPYPSDSRENHDSNLVLCKDPGQYWDIVDKALLD